VLASSERCAGAGLGLRDCRIAKAAAKLSWEQTRPAITGSHPKSAMLCLTLFVVFAYLISGLARILALAFVPGKLKPESFLRVRNPRDRGHGNRELAIAKSADSDSRDCAEPFDHPQITFSHRQSFRRQVCGRLSSWLIGPWRLQPWQARLSSFDRISVSIPSCTTTDRDFRIPIGCPDPLRSSRLAIDCF
jgi:hypothetical protein